MRRRASGGLAGHAVGAARDAPTWRPSRPSRRRSAIFTSVAHRISCRFAARLSNKLPMTLCTMHGCLLGIQSQRVLLKRAVAEGRNGAWVSPWSQAASEWLRRNASRSASAAEQYRGAGCLNRINSIPISLARCRSLNINLFCVNYPIIFHYVCKYVLI